MDEENTIMSVAVALETYAYILCKVRRHWHCWKKRVYFCIKQTYYKTTLNNGVVVSIKQLVIAKVNKSINFLENVIKVWISCQWGKKEGQEEQNFGSVCLNLSFFLVMLVLYVRWLYYIVLCCAVLYCACTWGGIPRCKKRGLSITPPPTPSIPLKIPASMPKPK